MVVVSARQYLDLPPSLVVEVTQDDIRDGKPGRAMHCAIAQAAKRVLGLPADSTSVDFDGLGLLRVWQGRHSRDFDLGPASQWFSLDFDLGMNVDPATFTGALLPVPRPREEMH